MGLDYREEVPRTPQALPQQSPQLVNRQNAPLQPHLTAPDCA